MKKLGEAITKFFEKNSIKKFTWSLHLVYGALSLTYIVPAAHGLATGTEVNWSRTFTLFWVLQTWFYAVTNFKVRDEAYEARRAARDAAGLAAAVNEINAAIVKRLKKLPPQTLRELGVSIKEVKKTDV